MQKRLGWALVVGGVVGLVWTAVILPSALAALSRVGVGNSALQRVWSFSLSLPELFRWSLGPGLTMGVGGCLATIVLLAVLLLVAGGRTRGIVAALAGIWVLVVVVGFGVDGHFSVVERASGDFTPWLLLAGVSLVVVTFVAMFAIVTGLRLGRPDCVAVAS